MVNYNNKRLTTFPKKKIHGLTKILDCAQNYLTSLPELPSSLTHLSCWRNELTTLPNLPSSLSILECDINELTTLPDLPSSLTYLSCSSNELMALPELPPSLTYLSCCRNQLTTLPDLPPSLNTLYCWSNELTTLPDLPETLYCFERRDNPLLEIKYPNLYDHLPNNIITPLEIRYVNEINSKERTMERTKQINQANILLELYMKRMMHPLRIQEILKDADDIDAAMNAYVETL